MKKILFLFFLLGPVIAGGQVITTFAGGGSSLGDGGPATAAIVNGPNGGVFDNLGNYYIAEILGQRIRKISSAGVITTVAGTGSSGFSGDGGPATAAKLNFPTKILIDTLGNLYIDDLNNFRIRKVNAATGIISTIAGNGTAGFYGDGIPATDAKLGGVEDICFDKFGNLYLSDYVNNRVRKINTAGIISTIAGHGGFSATGTGDGGPATAATFNWLAGLAIDDAGNIFVADFNGAKIRKINSSGIISTIAGNGVYTYSGDGIPATAAQINPLRITFDHSRNLIIADKYNRRILKIDNAGIIHCIAGNGISSFAGDGGLATNASFNFPAGISYDTCGNLYIADADNGRVRKVTFNPPPCVNLDVDDKIKIGAILYIYPNPANDILQIDDVAAQTNYRLLNLVGSSVQQGVLRQGRNSISVRSLPAGMYLLEVTDEEGRRVVRKIVKE